MSFNLTPSFDTTDARRVTVPRTGPVPQPPAAVGQVISQLVDEHAALISRHRLAYDIDNSLHAKGLGHLSVVPAEVHIQALSLRGQIHTAVQFARKASEVAPPKQPAPKKRVSAKRTKR